MRDLQIRFCIAIDILTKRASSWGIQSLKVNGLRETVPSFTDPCNVQTASLYLYFTIEGFIEISPLSPYINSKRHFYLSDKFSQVLGTSPSTARKSGKESPQGDGDVGPDGPRGMIERPTPVLHSRRNYWRDMKGPKLPLINPKHTFGNRIWALSTKFMHGPPDSLTVSLEFIRIIYWSFILNKRFRHWYILETLLQYLTIYWYCDYYNEINSQLY